MMNDWMSDERGAVTVDWVVLTAAATGLVLATMAFMSGIMERRVNLVDERINAPSVITRIKTSFNYTPHDTAQYEVLITSVSQLPDGDLEQIAAYSNFLNTQLTDTTDDETRGQVSDFSAAVDVAYDNAGTTRGTGTSFDETELTRISADLGYDAVAVAGG